MKLPFHTLDVFTAKRFAGNPLAVVLDADGLDDAQMQRIAREFNLAETVFVMKPDNPAHSARIRIFTPQSELPFAGHPTIGCAALLAELRMPSVNGERDAIILLEEKVGPVRVGVRLRDGGPAHGEFVAPELPVDLGEVPSKEDLSAALGLSPAEVGCENHLPMRLDNGNHPYIFVPVVGREALERAQPVQPYWDKVITDRGDLCTYVYCRQPVHTTSAFQARMFAPQHGIPEDPATGSAAAAFPGVIQAFDGLPDGAHKRVIEQGFQMRRESYITLNFSVHGGALDMVRVGGDTVRVSSGEIEV